jgi:FkbM family methyltransferase
MEINQAKLGPWLAVLRVYCRFLAIVHPALRRLRLRRLWSFPVPLLRTLQVNGYTPSVYGIWLHTNWSDATFVFGVTGRWGFKLFDLLRQKRDQNFLFIDVGANFGTYSVVASQNPRCIQTIAIEPNPTVFSQLERNVAINHVKNVQALNCGIASETGTAKLSISSHHLGASNFRNKGDTWVEVKVYNRTIFDELSKTYPGVPVFVKVDVEGAEPVVVRELVESQISDSIREVFLEVSPKWISNADIASMLNCLTGIGLCEQWRSYGKDQFDIYYTRN